MGSSNTKELKLYQNHSVGGLCLDLNKPEYYPGDLLIGNVWINALQDIEVYGLEVKLQVQEEWYYKVDKSEYSEKNYLNLAEISVDIQRALKAEGEKYILKKGTYDFPFTLNIPEHMQPSFEYKGIDSYTYLRYVAYACLLATKGDKFCLSNLNYVILRSPVMSLETSLSFSSCINIHSWLIFQKGTCILNASYPKNNYSYGEIVYLKLSIDNSRSKLKVQYLKITFNQKISFKDKKENVQNLYENELYSKKYSLNLLPNNILNDFKLEVFIDDNKKINKNLYLKGSTPYLHLFKDSNDVFKFNPTMDSNLIKCEYYIKLSIHFDSVVSYSYRPRIILPIYLTHQADSHPIQNDFSDVDPSSIRIQMDPNRISIENNQVFDINEYQSDYNNYNIPGVQYPSLSQPLLK